jgi:hypothetical protein
MEGFVTFFKGNLGPVIIRWLISVFLILSMLCWLHIVVALLVVRDLQQVRRFPHGELEGKEGNLLLVPFESVQSPPLTNRG